jgi:hypothetical protein
MWRTYEANSCETFIRMPSKHVLNHQIRITAMVDEPCNASDMLGIDHLRATAKRIDDMLSRIQQPFIHGVCD